MILITPIALFCLILLIFKPVRQLLGFLLIMLGWLIIYAIYKGNH